MPTNLAVVIAVSDYQSPTSPLPACARDAAVINAILRESGRFEDILELTKNATASHVKTQLSEFVSRHSSTDVGELLFYFSGHGQFEGNEFYFLLEDYDRRRRAQTSLTNNELDEMLRSLSPNLAVKFVDACQSGVTYVKESDALSNHLQKTAATYKHCYFMFSSNWNENSLADNEISHFTREIAVALRDHDGERIRYKDVMDHLSDAFENRRTQSPFFVTQANLTDVFALITPSLRSTLRALVPAEPGLLTSALAAEAEEHPLLTAVRVDSEKYVSKAAGLAAISAFGEELQAARLSHPLPLLYECDVRLSKDEVYPSGKTIGRWLAKRTDGILAEVEYTTETVTSQEKRPRNNPLRLAFGWDEYDYVNVSKEVSVPARISVTAETPFTMAHIDLTPKFGALPSQSGFVVICFSKRDFFAFFARVRLKDTDWESHTMPWEAEWKSLTCPLSDEQAMRRTARKVFEKLSDEITKEVEKAHLPRSKDQP